MSSNRRVDGPAPHTLMTNVPEVGFMVSCEMICTGLIWKTAINTRDGEGTKMTASVLVRAMMCFLEGGGRERAGKLPLLLSTYGSITLND